MTNFQVVLEKAKNHILVDVDGKEYIDLITQFAVMNFGYSHPKIVQAVVDQVKKLPLVNTGYINPLYAQFAERLTAKFGFDSIATMLSGSEAVESAIKIARKWAYVKKGIQADEAWILTTDRCYHGITLATMSLSNVIADRKYTKCIEHSQSSCHHRLWQTSTSRWTSRALYGKADRVRRAPCSPRDF